MNTTAIGEQQERDLNLVVNLRGSNKNLFVIEKEK